MEITDGGSEDFPSGLGRVSRFRRQDFLNGREFQNGREGGIGLDLG
jgi:hypothetical protein